VLIRAPVDTLWHRSDRAHDRTSPGWCAIADPVVAPCPKPEHAVSCGGRPRTVRSDPVRTAATAPDLVSGRRGAVARRGLNVGQETVNRGQNRPPRACRTKPSKAENRCKKRDSRGAGDGIRLGRAPADDRGRLRRGGSWWCGGSSRYPPPAERRCPCAGRLRVRGQGHRVERVTGIEPALSAWEVDRCRRWCRPTSPVRCQPCGACR
jgi:hypothetical protein